MTDRMYADPEAPVETGMLGRENDAFHRTLRQYPEASKALHAFWNDAFAGQPQPDPLSNEVARRIAADLATLVSEAEKHGTLPRIKSVAFYFNETELRTIIKLLRSCHGILDPAQSSQEPLWHRVQDQIDAWAQETLGEDAGVIMSWSDRLAQHLAPELRSSADSYRAQWPEPKVTNPDIPSPTAIPYINCLIHRVLDAQQDINHAANEGMIQSLCDAAALLDEVERALRTAAVIHAPPQTSGETERDLREQNLRGLLREARDYVEAADTDHSASLLDDINDTLALPRPK